MLLEISLVTEMTLLSAFNPGAAVAVGSGVGDFNGVGVVVGRAVSVAVAG